MNNLTKAILGGLALFLALGGPRLFKKDPATIKQQQVQQFMPDNPSNSNRPAVVQHKYSSAAVTFSGQPLNQIFSQDWLHANGKLAKKIKKARITYYLLANSDRCHIDSLSTCLRKKIIAKKIPAAEFQYTYFLDRVMIAGSGELFWQGQHYVTRYNLLRKAGWNSGEHERKNKYTCRNFQYNNKKALEFIGANINNKNVFTKWDEHAEPNGRTFSGQQAVNWQTVSVNLKDFPVSVPDPKRRNRLAAKFKTKNITGPFARSFIVIKTKDGRQFLTEAMDTGSGVKRNWIDWRIGNSSDQIKYFLALGSTVEATCYTFDDPDITLEKVLCSSRNFTAK